MTEKDTRTPATAAEFLTMVADALIARLPAEVAVGWIDDTPIIQFEGGLRFRIYARETNSSIQWLGKRDGVSVVTIHESDEDIMLGDVGEEVTR